MSDTNTDKLKAVAKLLSGVVGEHSSFYGEIVISIRDGNIYLVKKTETCLLRNDDKTNTGTRSEAKNER